MKEFGKFLVDNWSVIAVCCAALFDIIIVLVKCKNRTLVYDDSLTSLVVDLVQVAEAKFGAGNGDLKLKFVVSSLKNNERFARISEKVLTSAVERVLSTPQKKGE